MIDLDSLARPTVISEIDFEAILAQVLADAVVRFAADGIDYDVGGQETDPVKIVLEASSYRETLVRARINDAVRRTLLAFAKGSDLDHLGVAHGVARMLGEADDRFATRIVLKNMDRNSAGTEPRYQFIAMSAHIRVRDAVVYTEGRDPTIRVALLAADNNGVADAPLLAAVAAALQAPATRMINDRIVVEAAVRDVVNIAANVWLLPDAPADTLAVAEAALRAAWSVEGKIGRDLSPSWIMRHLSVAGIQRIEALHPVTNVAVPFNRIASIGSVSLTMMGRSY